MFYSVFEFTLLPRNSVVLRVLLSLLLTIDGLQSMNNKSLYLQNLPIRLLLPRKKKRLCYMSILQIM